MQSSIIKYLLTAGNVLLVTAAVYIGVDGFYHIMTAQMDISNPPVVAHPNVETKEKEKRQPLAHYRVIT